MTADKFIADVSGLQFVSVLSIFYICYLAFVVARPTLEKHVEEKLHYVNFGTVFSLGQIVFMFILHLSGSKVPQGLVRLCFSTWSATILFILLSCKFPHLIKRVGVAFIIVPVLITFSYEEGLAGFLHKVDSFGVRILGKAGEKALPSDDSKQVVSNGSPEDQTEATSKSGDTHSDSKDKVPSKRPPVALNLSLLLKGIFFFLNTFIVTSYYGRMWQYHLESKTSKETVYSDDTQQIVTVMTVALSIWMAFALLGKDLLSLGLVSGFLVLGVTVALRDFLTNFIAGMLLRWDKSVKKDDVISLDGKKCVQVTKTAMRYMIVEGRDKISILVPYSQFINKNIENWSESGNIVQFKLDIGVAYRSPIHKVKEIMASVCYNIRRVSQPKAEIKSTDDSCIHFVLKFKIRNPQDGIGSVISQVYEGLLKRFQEEGIEIPFPQQEIRLRRPIKWDKEVLTPEQLKEAESLLKQRKLLPTIAQKLGIETHALHEAINDGRLKMLRK